MNAFIELICDGDTYLVNVFQIVRVFQSNNGCGVQTTVSTLASDEPYEKVKAKIKASCTGRTPLPTGTL